MLHVAWPRAYNVTLTAPSGPRGTGDGLGLTFGLGDGLGLGLGDGLEGGLGVGDGRGDG